MKTDGYGILGNVTHHVIIFLLAPRVYRSLMRKGRLRSKSSSQATRQILHIAGRFETGEIGFFQLLPAANDRRLCCA